MFRKQLRRGVRGRRDLEGARRSRAATATPGTSSPPTSSSRPTSRACRGRRPRASSRSRARARSRCSATASRPTTSRPRARSRRTHPPGSYLIERGVEPKDFNSYGSRRGNHEVMMRGTFANIRLRNQLAPGHRGRLHRPPAGRRADDDLRRRHALCRARACRSCVLAGKEYGSGSSRDWAAKGPRLLGVRFVIAESYERIHRSNLVGHGRAAAPVRRRRVGRLARPDRAASASTSRRSRTAPARWA